MLFTLYTGWLLPLLLDCRASLLRSLIWLL